jgi:hypothetical protein
MPPRLLLLVKMFGGCPDQCVHVVATGNRFWMFDRQTVAFTYFSGDGYVLDHEVTTDPDICIRCIFALIKFVYVLAIYLPRRAAATSEM